MNIYKELNQVVVDLNSLETLNPYDEGDPTQQNMYESVVRTIKQASTDVLVLMERNQELYVANQNYNELKLQVKRTAKQRPSNALDSIDEMVRLIGLGRL